MNNQDRYKLIHAFFVITKVKPPIDVLLSVINKRVEIDIFKLDEALAQAYPEYHDKQCTYRGKTGYSMHDFIAWKFGLDALSIIERLIEPLF